MRDLRSNWRDHWNFDRQALVGMRKAESRLCWGFTPLIPCPPEPLREVIGLAAEREVPIHIHLAETKERGCANKRSLQSNSYRIFLVKAGLLNGKKATTHWNSYDQLEREYPQGRKICG